MLLWCDKYRRSRATAKRCQRSSVRETRRSRGVRALTTTLLSYTSAPDALHGKRSHERQPAGLKLQSVGADRPGQGTGHGRHYGSYEAARVPTRAVVTTEKKTRKSSRGSPIARHAVAIFRALLPAHGQAQVSRSRRRTLWGGSSGERELLLSGCLRAC